MPKPKITLREYFDQKCHKTAELVGLKVYKGPEGWEDAFYIREFDPMDGDQFLPAQVFAGVRPGEETGYMHCTADLYLYLD